MRIGFFGAGRVAAALAPALAAAGHQVAFVASRTPGSAAALAGSLLPPCLALALPLDQPPRPPSDRPT